MFLHMDWSCFGCTEPESEPPEPVHFARSRSRSWSRWDILLEDGTGVEAERAPWSRSRPKFIRLRIPAVTLSPCVMHHYYLQIPCSHGHEISSQNVSFCSVNHDFHVSQRLHGGVTSASRTAGDRESPESRCGLDTDLQTVCNGRYPRLIDLLF